MTDSAVATGERGTRVPDAPPPPVAAVPRLVKGAALGMLWLSQRTQRRLEWVTVPGWVVAAVPLQILLRRYAVAPPGTLVRSDRANSFHSPAQRWSAGQFISSYMDIVGDLPKHARTNMPGKIMLYHLLGVFAQSPVALAVGVIVVSNLGALLVYPPCRSCWRCGCSSA